MAFRIYVSEKGLSSESPKNTDLVIVIEPRAKYYDLYFEITAYWRNKDSWESLDITTDNGHYSYPELKDIFNNIRLIERLVKDAKDELKTLLNFIKTCDTSAKSILESLKWYLRDNGLNDWSEYLDYDKIVNAFKTWINENKTILRMDKDSLIRHKIKSKIKEWHNKALAICQSGIYNYTEWSGSNLRQEVRVSFNLTTKTIYGEFIAKDLTNNVLFAKAIYSFNVQNRNKIYKYAHELNKYWDYHEFLRFFNENGQLINFELYNFNIKLERVNIRYDSDNKELELSGIINAKTKAYPREDIVKKIIDSPHKIIKSIMFKHGCTINLNNAEFEVIPLENQIYQIIHENKTYTVSEEIIDIIYSRITSYTYIPKPDEILELLKEYSLTLESMQKISDILNVLGIPAEIIIRKFKYAYWVTKDIWIKFRGYDGNDYIISSNAKVYKLINDNEISYICCYPAEKTQGKIIVNGETIELNETETEIIAKVLTIAKPEFPKDETLLNNLKD